MRELHVMNRPLAVDQALFVLGLLPSFRAVEIAEFALLAGHNSESIIELASYSKEMVTWADAELLFRKTLADLDVNQLNRMEAQVIAARYLANQYCVGELSTRSLLDEMYRLAYGTDDGAANNPMVREELLELDYLDSMYTEAIGSGSLRGAKAWEKDILKCCRRLIEHDTVSDSLS